MKKILNKYLKIGLILGTAFVLSNFSIKNVFLADSPKINPNVGKNMIAKIDNFWSKTSSLIAFNGGLFNFFGSTYNSTGLIKDLPAKTLDALNAPLHKVSQGVYAGEKNDIQVIEIRSNEIDYLEYTFNVNGKEIKIKVPKDQQPPSQEVMEGLF